MKTQTGFVLILITIASGLTLGACISPEPKTLAATSVSLIRTATPTNTKVVPTQKRLDAPSTAVICPATRTSRPTPTPRPTRTSPPDATSALPVAVIPEATPVFIGTPLPTISEPIGVANYTRLRLSAEWGKGNIFGVAFTPGGNAFVVGSAIGYAIYDLQNLEAPPKWIYFDTPSTYESLFFSSDGKYMLLEGFQSRQIRRFDDGQIVKVAPDLSWIKTTLVSTSWGGIKLDSPDGQNRFESYTTHDEENWNLEFSIREVHDKNTGELLYQLTDQTVQVLYEDRAKPEGCDLHAFSPCGNAFDPSAALPYRVGFSPSSESLAILYRAPNLYDSNRFSFLRVYSTSDGKLLNIIGSFTRPVETYAYAPDSKTLLVGYVDGSIQLWDIARNDVVYSAWHFSAPQVDIKFSQDGKYLMVQRPESLEVRLTRDGTLLSRFKATAFAVSPIENLVAIGEIDGTVGIYNLDNGQTLFSQKAHNEEVYALEFSPDGRLLVSSGQDCVIRSWDVYTGRFLHYFEEQYTEPYGDWISKPSRIFVYYMRFIPGSSQLVGYGSWSRVASWNTNNGASQYLIEPDPLDYYQGMVTLKPHYPEFFGIDLQEQIFYVDNMGYQLANGEKAGEYQFPAELPEGCAPNGPLSKDGKLVFTRGYDNREGQVCILGKDDYKLMQIIQVLPKPQADLFYDEIDWLYLSPDGMRLVVSTYSGVLYVYQVMP